MQSRVKIRAIAFCIAVGGVMGSVIVLAVGSATVAVIPSVLAADEAFDTKPQLVGFDLADATVAFDAADAHRHRVFRGLGKTSFGLTRLARQKSPDTKEVQAGLEKIVAFAREIPQGFHPDTAALPPHKEGALPIIWEKPDEFVNRAADLEQAALDALAADTAELSASLERIGATCSACHRTFRAKR